MFRQIKINNQNKTMFYHKVYPKSWQALFKSPSLLFFGLFASILGFNELKIIFNLTDTAPDFISSVVMSWVEIFMLFSSAQLGWSNMPDLLMLFGLFVIFSIATILAVSSQGALIKASLESKKTKESFISYLKTGVEKFWPLLGLNLINTLIGYFFIVLVIEPIIYFLASNNEWIIYILLAIVTFFVLIPLVIMISFVTRYGAAYVVLRNESLPQAFTHSWELFKANWIITIENAFVLTVITVAYFLALITLIMFIFVPFLIFATLMSTNDLFFGLIISLGVILGIIVFILGVSFFSGFYNIVWANIWTELNSPGKSHSKIHRLAHKHLPILTR